MLWLALISTTSLGLQFVSTSAGNPDKPVFQCGAGDLFAQQSVKLEYWRLPDLLDTRGKAFEVMESVRCAILFERLNVIPDCPIHIGIDVLADIIECGR